MAKRPKKVAFEDLKPHRVKLGGTVYNVKPREVARLCPQRVKGGKGEVEAQILRARVAEEIGEEPANEFLQTLGMIAAHFSSDEPSVVKPPPDDKFDAFMKPWRAQGKERIGRIIYSGQAKDEAGALEILKEDAVLAQEEKKQREEKKRTSIFEYEPVKVETDKGPLELPLAEFARICPSALRVPKEALSSVENRLTLYKLVEELKSQT